MIIYLQTYLQNHKLDTCKKLYPNNTTELCLIKEKCSPHKVHCFKINHGVIRGLLNPIWSFLEVIHIYFFDFQKEILQ